MRRYEPECGTCETLDQGCELPGERCHSGHLIKLARRGYGAAGDCSSAGSAAGPFIAGAAIVVASTNGGVVSVVVEPTFMLEDLATDS